MKKEIDCRYTNEIVCPYCGHEKSDSWEYLDSNRNGEQINDIECYECNKLFDVIPYFDVTYSSYKKDD